MPETVVQLAAAIDSMATLWVDDAGQPLLDMFVWHDAEDAPPENEDHDCSEAFCHEPAASFMVGVREAKELIAMLAAVIRVGDPNATSAAPAGPMEPSPVRTPLEVPQ